FEAGISLPNEMEHLEEIIQPKYGILTNIGTAHDEGFLNREQKIKEKIKLFKNCSDVFLHKNQKIEDLLPVNCKKHTWSFIDETATLFVSKNRNNNKTELTFKNKQTTFSINIPFFDDNSIENVITCVNFMLFIGTEIALIQNKVADLYPVELRLQAKKGINNCLIIDDSYSVDYPSLKIALNFLEQQNLHLKKTIILSDVFTSGISIESLYSQVK
ncbi:MAG TPA: bifunctional UDP-N-acetylmuramoyl-tripeptide:D-alanyl-D-alanine ligase/alanine racemase, partial [Flavobacterium sp.]|nr:bifunctional UDP-N-acetylmuramoyl-tripeptide:D-alanyl-D-alanine ligase/alanine racemase [Flavobacterium sp.]